MIKDCLCRMSLPIELCRGQCYDGASVMAGAVAGVSSRIAADEPRAVYVHCLAHSLNLALQDSARNLPIYRDMMEYTKDLVNLIRLSPKRSALLCSMQGDDVLSAVTCAHCVLLAGQRDTNRQIRFWTTTQLYGTHLPKYQSVNHLMLEPKQMGCIRI